MTKAQIIKELQREQKMRIQVWKGKKNTNGTYFFTDMKKQNQYNCLVMAERIFTKMTDHEFSTYMLKVAKDQFQEPQKELFQ